MYMYDDLAHSLDRTGRAVLCFLHRGMVYFVQHFRRLVLCAHQSGTRLASLSDRETVVLQVLV